MEGQVRGRPALEYSSNQWRKLRTAGGDLDAKVHGRTLLHHAAWLGDVELVEALLECGADPEVLDDDHGATPLGWAEWAHAPATAALLTELIG